MALPLADESGLSINCAGAAGLPPATQKHLKEVNMTSLFSRNGSTGPILV
jgi:hypothetical protein